MYIPPTVPRLKGGFTLLEVIAAMALITLVIGGVYGIADGAIRLGTSMSKARVAEMRISHFVSQWRDYLENMPPNVRLTAGLGKVARGAAGSLLIEGGSVPFAWSRQVRLADAVEFSVTKGKQPKSFCFVVRHLKKLERPTALESYSMIAELPLLEDLKAFQVQFYDANDKRWFADWDPQKRGYPPLFVKLNFAFLDDPREHEFTFWLANDLTAPVASSDQATPPPAVPKA